MAPTPRSAIDETAFASSGDIVVVHADGYLESFVPKEVIALIRRGATASEDGRLHLIDEKHSVALLGERRRTSSSAAGT